MFTGFSEEALRFLTDIRLNNNQAFYEANRERYDTTTIYAFRVEE